MLTTHARVEEFGIHGAVANEFMLLGERRGAVASSNTGSRIGSNIGKIQRYGDIGRWKKERKTEIRQ